MELKFYKASFSAPDGFFDSKIIRAESLERAEEIAEDHRRDCGWPHVDVTEDVTELKGFPLPLERDLDEYLCFDCGRMFKFEAYLLSSECPYCGGNLIEEILS